MSKPILRVSSGIFLSLTIAALALAQQTPPAPPPLPPPVKDATLDKLVGSWTATGEMGGMKYLDRVNCRWGINKQFLITDVKSTDPNNPKKVYFEGHGVLRYETGPKEYVMHWFDAYGSTQEFIGDVTGNVLTLTSKGEKRTERLTYTLDKGSIKLVMDAAEKGGELRREWEATYTRIKTPPPPPPPAPPAGEKKPKS